MKSLRVMVGVPLKFEKGAVAPIGITIADVVSHVRISGGTAKDKNGKSIVVSKEDMIKKSIINTNRHLADDNGLYTKSELTDMNVVNHNCDCSVDEFAGKTMQDYYSELNDYLYPASKLHNAKSISDEILTTTDYIKKGTIRNFYRMKTNSINVAEHLFGIDTKGTQTRIRVGNPN